MNEIRHFVPCHLWNAEKILIPPRYLEGLIERYKDQVQYHIMSIFHNDRLIGIAGVKVLHPGVAEPFAIFCENKVRYVRQIVKAVKDLIQYAEREKCIYRLQTPIPVSEKVRIRFAKHFGFIPEGILLSYDPDTKEDCVIMGRVSCRPQA